MTTVPATTTPATPAPTSPPRNPFVEQVANRIFATGFYAGEGALLFQALNAETLAEAMNVGELLSGQDHVDQRIRFNSVMFADSDPDLDARIPYYAICEVVLDDGTAVVRKMSVGAEQPLGVLIRAAEQGWFPFEGKFEAVKLDSVRTALNLVPVPARVTNTA